MTEISDVKKFYEDSLKCPYIQKSIKLCPFIQTQVKSCPYLSQKIENESITLETPLKVCPGGSCPK